jgi:hypothetical protein
MSGFVIVLVLFLCSLQADIRFSFSSQFFFSNEDSFVISYCIDMLMQDIKRVMIDYRPTLYKKPINITQTNSQLGNSFLLP